MLPKPNTVRRRAIARFFARQAHRPGRLVICSFLVAILLGAVVLCTPFANARNADGIRCWTHPVDALFTATSAVCVTGLIVKDTGGGWSLFGQLTILALIQVGGLGIMTIYAFLLAMMRKRLSMGVERVLGGVIDADATENVGTLIKFICLLTLFAEAIGAVGLYLSWRPEFSGFWQCAYHSVFHAISAFCNAGFSLNADSMVKYQGNLAVNGVMWSLIIVGGLGFLVVRDLGRYARWRLLGRSGPRARLRVHTRVVLAITALLLVLGFVVILGTETNASFDGMTFKTRVLSAIFQSVTPRTAGFNTVETGSLAPSTTLLMMALMFIGGSPGSTAGGVKTSTVGIMVASILATARGRREAEMFHHSVRQETVHRVASIILLSVSVLVTGMFMLLISERTLIADGRSSFMQVAFEAASAFGTVGLSLGLTAKLSIAGRLIIPVLMFVGRLGPVTLMMTAASSEGSVSYSFPEGQVLVG